MRHKAKNKGFQVLMPMIEPVANFTQKKVKEFLGYAPVRIQPVLGITPKPFNAVDVVSPFRHTVLLSNGDMLASHRQRDVRLPVVGVVQASGPGVPLNQADHFLATAAADGKHLHHPIPLKDTEDDDLAGRAPAPFALFSAAKRGFIAFQVALEGLTQRFLIGAAGPRQTIEAFHRSRTGRGQETLPIDRHAQDKPFQQTLLNPLCKAARLPDRSDAIAVAALLAFVSTISQFPAACMKTFRTLFHWRTSINLVQFG